MSNSIFSVFHKVVGMGIVSLMVPASAFAASAWSTVEVNQAQSGSNHWVTEDQSASITTTANFGNQAAVSAHADGTQHTWTNSSANQSQTLQAGSALNWQNNAWPAQATGSTMTSVVQDQHGTSALGYAANQNANTAESSRIDGVSATAAGHIQQAFVHDDATQHESIAGQTHVDGYINPSWSAWSACNSGCTPWAAGGHLVQTVQVFVQNVLTF